MTDLGFLCLLYLRPPDSWSVDGSGNLVGSWSPPLTTSEQATLADLQTMARFGVSADLSLAEFQALKPRLAEIRTFRTRTTAQWQALSASQREADEVQYLNDLTDVLRALLRS